MIINEDNANDGILSDDIEQLLSTPKTNKNDDFKEESTFPKESSDSKIDMKELEAVYDVPVQISAVLGRSTMPVHQLLKLGRGAVVELDRRVGEAIDIYVNNRMVARGEVVIVDDHLGVTMTEIIKSDRS